MKTYRKKFVVPIYEVKVRLVVADQIVDLIMDVKKDEQPERHRNTEAWTYLNYPDAWIMFKTDALTWNTLAHEVDHLSHLIMAEVGIKETDDSDEAFAYMNGWLSGKVMDFIEDEFKLQKKTKRKVK